MSEIEKFKPENIMQTVKDRIKATFVSLIPDEKWNEMVKNEIDDFFKEKEISYHRTYKSNFQQLVREEISAECKKRIVEYLGGKEFAVVWKSNGQLAVSDAVQEILIKNSSKIFAEMFGVMFDNALAQTKTRSY